MAGAAGFPTRVRLRRPREFQRVFATGGRYPSRHLVLIAASNDLGYARLGLAISKRVAPRALDRNRLKRLVRESFRQRHADLPAMDCVVVARRGAHAAANADLYHVLARLWRELGEPESPAPRQGNRHG